MLQVYFSDVEQTGETDFVEKPKSIYGTPFGKVAVPKKWTSSNATQFGREGHIHTTHTHTQNKKQGSSIRNWASLKRQQKDV